MRVHVLSDLHLDLAEYETSLVDADLIVLAGDISQRLRGLRWAIRELPEIPVVYVPGNHEYYGAAIPKMTQKLKAEAEGSNVHVLDNDVFEIDGLTVLGSTLWSDFDVFDKGYKDSAIAGEKMNDFKRIRVSPGFKRLRPMDMSRLHSQARGWLRRELLARNGPRVVVTHHAPSLRSIRPCDRQDPLNAAYVANMEELILETSPMLWIHGHVHQAADYLIGSTRVVSNPRGYADETETGFDTEYIVEVNV